MSIILHIYSIALTINAHIKFLMQDIGTQPPDVFTRTRLRVYKSLFILNSTEHDISSAHENYIPTNKEVSCFKPLRCYIYHASKC